MLRKKKPEVKNNEADIVIRLRGEDLENILVGCKSGDIGIHAAMEEIDKLYNRLSETFRIGLMNRQLEILALNHSQFVEAIIEQHKDFQELIKVIKEK